ncbi:MAG: SEL1-like repeat protein [Verrucomicrobiae bacterium]|nr:SEL1-like repeat protein [Verrucomicrobiae bacterium]MCP5521118.1 SEL1-like repeat protein [Verrucomicrobiales bacterium]
MKTVRFAGTSLVALLISTTAIQAQLRSVTRRTIQLPLGLPTLLQPQPWNTSPAIGTAPTPTMAYVRVPRRNREEVDPAERERAQLQFEMECAARGLPSFQFSLAGRYLTGNGVPCDPGKALELLQSAAEKGHDKARRVVADFERLVAAQKRPNAASAWQAKHLKDVFDPNPNANRPEEGTTAVAGETASSARSGSGAEQRDPPEPTRPSPPPGSVTPLAE